MAESTDTSTTTPGTPTTNEELGVISGRAANAQIPAVLPTLLPPDDATLRLQALQVAQAAGGTPEEVMDRAEKYTTYLKDGRSDG